MSKNSYPCREVPVLLVKQVDTSYHSAIKEDRFIHNIAGLRQVNYQPGPSMEDVERVIANAEALTAHNGIRSNIILTRDGYLYACQMTAGYCDGDITVTPEQLRSAIPTTTIIY